jgi:acyl-[acyl carrier protein]--UDP-N-acetylglucosamine O-acyltransferase
VIEEGVKLDNLVQVAHNVAIGAHTAIAACTGIAGSAKIGRHCTIGGAAMIFGHIEIADGTRISTNTLITKSLPKATYTSALPFSSEVWRSAVHMRNLDRWEPRQATKNASKKLAANMIMDIEQVMRYAHHYRYVIDKVIELDSASPSPQSSMHHQQPFLAHFPARR